MYYVITKIYMCRIFFLLLLHTDKTHQCAEVDVVLTNESYHVSEDFFFSGGCIIFCS